MEYKINKNEINIIIVLELRDELSNQKSTNHSFLCESKFDLDGKFVETIMSFKDFETFEICSESMDEHYDEGSITVQAAAIFIETV